MTGSSWDFVLMSGFACRWDGKWWALNLEDMNWALPGVVLGKPCCIHDSLVPPCSLMKRTLNILSYC